MNLQRIMAVTHNEWREIRRDRMYVLLAFLLPLMLMLVFGYGMTQSVEHMPFAIVDEDRSALSRDYAHHFIDSHYFAFKGYLRSAREADALLADGRVRVVLVIGPQFQERLVGGRVAVIQRLVDGTFTTPVRSIQGYIEAINSAASGALQAQYLTHRLGVPFERAKVMLQPITMAVRYLYNQELRSIWSISPSLIMFSLMLAAPLLMALSVVREKETGSIYHIYASTVSRAEYLAGKLLPNVMISFVNATILLVMATSYFGAPFKGSLAFFLPATLIFVVCSSSIGLLVSLLVRTQQAALFLIGITCIVVSLHYSGMLEPVAAMTGSTYVMAHLLPPMYYNTIVQSVFLKGGGLAALWLEVVTLAAYAAGLLGVCYLLFHKRTRV
jgi:ABC-2 type transport system permease protein/ribosome-dependent ATPase